MTTTDSPKVAAQQALMHAAEAIRAPGADQFAPMSCVRLS